METTGHAKIKWDSIEEAEDVKKINKIRQPQQTYIISQDKNKYSIPAIFTIFLNIDISSKLKKYVYIKFSF